jgi:hypothetical protein
MTSTNTIKFNRDGNLYTFTCDKFTASVWKFESAYGDTQWGCDILHADDRMRGTDAGYQQFDYLADARRWITSLIAA